MSDRDAALENEAIRNWVECRREAASEPRVADAYSDEFRRGYLAALDDVTAKLQARRDR